MKSFAIAAAMLASAAAALPAIAPTLPAPVLGGAGLAEGSIKSAAHMVAGQAFGQVHSVVSVTNGQKTMLVELEKSFAQRLTGLDLGTVTSPIGEVTQIAPKIGGLNLNNLGSGYLTVLTGEGQVALVELSSEVESVLSTLALPQVGTLVGGFVGTVEGVAAGGLKGNAVSNVMHVTGLNGNDLLVKLEPTVTGLLGQLSLGPLGSLGSLGSLTSLLEGPVGSVIGQVPVASDLAAKATSLGSDPTKLIGVVTQDGASVLLVEVEGTLSSLLATLGLGSLESTIGSVVPAGSLPL